MSISFVHSSTHSLSHSVIRCDSQSRGPVSMNLSVHPSSLPSVTDCSTLPMHIPHHFCSSHCCCVPQFAHSFHTPVWAFIERAILVHLSISHFSVTVPFKGDYVGLGRDQAWNQLASSLNDNQVVWADLVMKVNRADGKARENITSMIMEWWILCLYVCLQAREKLLVITGLSFMVLDPKSMKPLYRVPLSALQKVSVSQLSDDFFIFHVASVSYFKTFYSVYDNVDFVGEIKRAGIEERRLHFSESPRDRAGHQNSKDSETSRQP